MTIKNILFLILIFFLSENIFCQDMAYFYSGSRVNNIVQENDSIYWLATTAGLRKFNSSSDEISHFNKINSNLVTNEIIDLDIDSQGNLWLATKIGLIRFNESSTQVYDTDNSNISSNNLYTISVDAQDNVWGGTIGDGFFIFSNEDFENYNSNNTNHNIDEISDIKFDSQGVAWMATAHETQAAPNSNGLIKFDGNQFTEFNTDNSDIPHNAIRSIAIDTEDNIYVSSNHKVGKFEDNAWITLTDPIDPTFFDGIRYIDVDQSGNLWIAMYRSGIAKYTNGDWDFYTREDLDGELTLRRLFIDSSNTIHTCSYYEGLNRFSNFEWDKINISNSPLTSDFVREIEIEEDGTVWMINRYSIYKYKNGAWTVYNPELITSEDGVLLSFLAIDDENNIWVGFKTEDNDLSTLRYSNGTWSTHNVPSLYSNLFRSLVRGPNNDLLLVLVSGIYKLNGAQWTLSELDEEVEWNGYGFIVRDSEGNIWISKETNLYKKNNSGLYQYSLDSLNNNDVIISSIVIDLDDNIWLSLRDGKIIFFDGNSFNIDHTFDYDQSNPIASFLPEAFIDLNNNYWITHSLLGDGVFKRISNNNTWDSLNTSNSNILVDDIIDIEQNENGDFWFAHGYVHGGVTTYNKNGIVISTFTMPQLDSSIKIIQTTPNPFSSQVNVKYETSLDTRLTFQIFDQFGMLRKTAFTNKFHSAGVYDFLFEPASNSPNGIFYLVITSDKEVLTRKILLVN